MKGGGPMSISSIEELCSSSESYPYDRRYGNLHFLSGAPF